jgi:hypothetical protein
MTGPPPAALPLRQRNLLFLRHPRLWPLWPFLPLVRRRPGADEEHGVLYDALHARGQTGYSATVFVTNLFCLPPSVEQFLALPHETYDTAEEVYAAGWRVD